MPGDQSFVDARRSADAAEVALAEQRREAEERRAAEVEAARPKTKLTVERENKDAFRLRNIGCATAVDVRVSELGVPGASSHLRPVGVTLVPDEATVFMILAGWSEPMPATLYMTWEG
ncbi:hypothetical protein [Streptomyces sp. NPDC059943]|uniref:hypothetical protein n=1 Tax=Streptomyces sp. NPDC059943 TaxID=3347010 RepID=UPI003665A483